MSKIFSLAEIAARATAAALQNLSDQPPPANAVGQALPECGILPPDAVDSMISIAGFVHDEHDGEESLRLNFNATMCSWQERGKKTFFLLPAVPPPKESHMSMGFLNNSMVQLWQLRGKSTVTTI